MPTISMYEASVPAFDRMLSTLASLLDKAEAHAVARKIDPAVLLSMRLFPDMFPLIRQVQLATDFAKGTAARLAGVEVPKYADEETNVESLKKRLATTQAFIRSLPATAFDASAERDITIPMGGEPTTFKGLPYLLHFALPNFYFHATTAYNILRHAGVEVGKRDFMGPMR